MFDNLSRFFIIAGSTLSFLVFKTDWSIARIIFNSTPSLETNTQSLELQKMTFFQDIKTKNKVSCSLPELFTPFS